MTIKGSVDQISNKGVAGWIYNTADSKPMVVEAVLHHRVVGETIADVLRHDLAEVGFGDGRCGFVVDFTMPVDTAYLPFVAVRPAGGDVELPRTSLSGFADYFKTLYSSLPTAGRHRSIYGGFWTDRTDALAMLAGKRAIGTLSNAAATAVERFIVHGHVVVDISPKSLPHEFNLMEFDDIEQQVARMVFRPAIDEILKGIVDDEPIIIHGSIVHEVQRQLHQPSSGRNLPSPLECFSLLSPCGATPSTLELVRGSHRFPDFTRAGEARWLLLEDHAAMRHAASVGSSVELAVLEPNQVILIAAGKIYRCLDPSADGTTEALCVPRRQFPLRAAHARSAKRAPNFAGEIALMGQPDTPI
jgi:hypothetical protein